MSNSFCLTLPSSESSGKSDLAPRPKDVFGQQHSELYNSGRMPYTFRCSESVNSERRKGARGGGKGPGGK